MTATVVRPPVTEVWPDLPLSAWQETYTTLHRWIQIIGKIRLALAPALPHCWQVPLYVTARGLTTSPIPYGNLIFQIDFDFIDHELHIETSQGAGRSFELAARTVADFYREVMTQLQELGINVAIWTVPVEVEERIPFDSDVKNRADDPQYARRCWRILLQVDRVVKTFRSHFIGKVSPVHFFWGSFDIAVTRFSGRRAPAHPGGAPGLSDVGMREAYSPEVSSAGFLPGGGATEYAAFYSDPCPETPGLRTSPR